MKKLIILLFVSSTLFTCSKKLIPNNKNEESLIGKINNEIKSNSIGEHPLIILNQDRIAIEELTLLNEFKISDFTTIEFLNRKESKEKFGDEGKYGAVLIAPFVDDLLTQEYYRGINNTTLLKSINDYVEQGKIKRNPILVLDGQPLRGDKIATEINKLGPNGIKEINLLKKEAAYKIYGIRSINGVLLIDSK